MQNPSVIILRGITGSGKSTYWRTYWPSARAVSADFFFERDGKYLFDPARLAKVHQHCWASFMKLLQEGAPLIVVDNTNLTAAEIAPYMMSAQAAHLLNPQSPRYEVHVVTLSCPTELAVLRGTHGVAHWRVGAMQQQLWSNPLPPWYPETKITLGEAGYPAPPPHLPQEVAS